MCKGVMVCHGDKATVLPNVYTEDQVKEFKDECQPAMYYITTDGKYAIDADFISAEDLETADLTSVPKIALK